MNILIMRHGEAQSLANSDRERELTNSGRDQLGKAAACLSTLKMSFDQVWVSPYRRTEQTANELVSVIGKASRYKQDILVPESDPAAVVEAIEQSALESLLIVSHQPLVSALVGLLVDADPRLGPPMSPASMAYINTDIVLPGCGALKWLRHAPHFDIR